MTLARKCNLEPDRLRSLLAYDAETGIFTWCLSCGRLAKAGTRAGGTNGSTTHVRIGLDGAFYYAHRLAWLYVHGVWPIGSIDHMDGDPANNRMANLRDVSHSVNLQNQRRARSDSKTGLLGASFHKRIGKFAAALRVGPKIKHLGYFGTAQEAHAVYVLAKRIHHEGCTI